MFAPKNHPETLRILTGKSKPVPQSKIESALQEQWELFNSSHKRSGSENIIAKKSTPLGVQSSFQHWDPFPISIKSAKGAWMEDVDGRKVLDLSMGFGAMLAGHLNPTVVDEVKKMLEIGMLFVTPSPLTRDAAERMCLRFGIDQIRFTNSGTESTMYAIRTARGYTGREGVVKLEGGYHGSYDALSVSVKPSLDQAGSAEDPTPVIQNTAVPGEVYVVPYNNADSLERIFKKHGSSIACFVLEPVMENIGIVLPDQGYLERVRELCSQYGIVLIFDEVKTGLTAGFQGAAQRLGVKPDLICLAKSIGGGIPLAAFGGKKEIMETITEGKMSHLGTFNGHLLGVASIIAMDIVATKETLTEAEDFNKQALTRISGAIEEFELPAHSVGFGVKGCTTWSTEPVRNYRDYKATNFDLAQLSFLWSVNHDIMSPPGLDEQWLISFAHKQEEIDFMVDDFRNFARYLRS
ncbi:MAG: aminotransferase class III-fold pyridoxal phosphate-dependent enzyme [Actinomycetota bacterium]|nr:aminotransferase class III-fold pyridoxal phosphate-dependent enzyme [Actinomycetota bacterium]